MLNDNRDIRRVHLSRCFLDRTYQRGLTWKRALAITNELDPNRLSTPTVSKRKNGTFAVIDGQHRIEALRQAGYDTVKAVILHGLTVEEESILFNLLNGKDHHEAGDKLGEIRTTRNNIAKPRPAEHFKAALAGKNVVAVGVKEILDEFGFVITPGSRELTNISAVSLLMNLYQRDRVLLRMVFEDLGAMVLDEKVGSQTIAAIFNIRFHRVVTKSKRTPSVPPELVKKLRSYQMSRVNSASKPDKRNTSHAGAATYGPKGHGTVEATSLLSLLNAGKRRHHRWRLAPLQEKK